LKQHKLWFDEECSKLLDQRKLAIAMVAESKSKDGGGLNSVRCETSRTFRNRKTECLKQKLMNLKQTEKNIRDLYRDIDEFKNSYQPRTVVN
jgi:chorismate mutase